MSYLTGAAQFAPVPQPQPPQLCLATAFAAAMDRLGPFEPHPALALAVSGGADSMALAILAQNWCRQREASALALVVDHGLRPASADQAMVTIERLTRLGIPATLLVLVNLKHGPALAERARIARYEIFTNACRQAGRLHLLLGHHAADQIETLAMRVLRGSQTHGLAGMSALVETPCVRLLRPLLGIAPAQLRHFLTSDGLEWIEDPSNDDLRALRPRLRHHLAAHATGDTSSITELQQAMSAVASLRLRQEQETAAELAHRASIRPEGFALLSPGRIGSAALAALIRTIAGASYAPSPAQINQLAARPRPASVAGVRLVQAGRLGDGLLIVREEAAIMPPVEARPDTIWDNRFRLVGGQNFPAGTTMGKLGADAARFRDATDLPAVVLRTLPAGRIGDVLTAVPHLRYASARDDAVTTGGSNNAVIASGSSDTVMKVLFTPPQPLAGLCFVSVN